MNEKERRFTAAWERFILERMSEGFTPYFMTFQFNALPGSQLALIQQMHRELERVYATFVTRVERKPRSPERVAYLPIMLCWPDFPVAKRYQKNSIRDVALNGGLHYHAILLIPHTSRLRDIEDHFLACQQRYIGPERRLSKIDVEAIYDVGGGVVGYGRKSLERGRVDDDATLILPRSTSELD